MGALVGSNGTGENLTSVLSSLTSLLTLSYELHDKGMLLAGDVQGEVGLVQSLVTVSTSCWCLLSVYRTSLAMAADDTAGRWVLAGPLIV